MTVNFNVTFFYDRLGVSGEKGRREALSDLRVSSPPPAVVTRRCAVGDHAARRGTELRVGVARRRG